MRSVYRFSDFIHQETPVSIFETNGVDTDYSKEQADIISNRSLDFDFINDNIPIEPFYLFSEALISNMKMSGLNDDRDSIVYITLCALAILFEEPKEKYKQMFEELRLRGIYGALKPIVNATQQLKTMFDELAEVSGTDIKDFKEAFEYTELFTPFMMAVSTVICVNNIKPDSLIIDDNLSGDIILAMRNLDLNGEFKEAVDKINIDVDDIGDDIKKYGEFKNGLEIIQDNKEH